MKEKKDNLHSKINKVLKCWKKHFHGHFKTTFQLEPDALNEIPDASNNVIKESLI